MKRWNCATKEFAEAPDVDAFLTEIIAVCERHGMTLGHEDREGAFEVYRSKEPDAIQWLLAAHIAHFNDEDEEN